MMRTMTTTPFTIFSETCFFNGIPISIRNKYKILKTQNYFKEPTIIDELV